MAGNRARPVQPHIPGLARSDKKPMRVRRTEKVLQAHARQVLGSLGYASMEAGAARARVKLKGDCKCPRCQFTFEAEVEGYPTGWQGNTVGLPDLLFFRYSPLFPPVFVPVEMKGEGTPVRKEQQDLANEGRSVIAHSERQAILAVLRAELAMDAYRLDPERRERIERFLRENEGHLGEYAEPDV